MEKVHDSTCGDGNTSGPFRKRLRMYTSSAAARSVVSNWPLRCALQPMTMRAQIQRRRHRGWSHGDRTRLARPTLRLEARTSSIEMEGGFRGVPRQALVSVLHSRYGR